jgi:hypothetical protein
MADAVLQRPLGPGIGIETYEKLMVSHSGGDHFDNNRLNFESWLLFV